MSGVPSSQRDRDLPPGTRFGRYEIVRRIGTGGMATVYEALRTDIQKRVALKLLHPWHALRTDVVQRFVNEARIASRIEHPNVLGISDMGVENDVPFMAMDLLEGEELFTVMHREKTVPVTRLADLLLPVVSALGAAHEKGILHRDIKPENIFLARRRTRGEHPVLLDFGISKVRLGDQENTITAAGEVLGTPPYMAPEQVEHGMHRFDARSDQYALGVVLYEAAAGVLPYPEEGSVLGLLKRIAKGGAPAPSVHQPSLPQAFDALVLRALSVSPRDRFPTVVDLGRELIALASPLTRTVWGEEFGLPLAEVAGALSDPPLPPPGASNPPVRRTSPPPRASAPPRRPAVEISPAQLQVVACLSQCENGELTALAALGTPVLLARGAILFEQGAKGESFWLLVAGDIELSTADVKAVARPGALLGAMTLCHRGARPVTAAARTEATLLELRREDLETLTDLAPGVAEALLEHLTRQAIARLRTLDGRFAELLEEPSPRPAPELRRLAAAAVEWHVPVDAGASGRLTRR